MNRQPYFPPTKKQPAAAALLFFFLCLTLLGMACGGSPSREPLPTLANLAVVPTEAPTLVPTMTLPPTSTPPTPVTSTFTPTSAAATPGSPDQPTTGTIPPTQVINTPIVFPTNTRFLPTNTPRVPTSTPTFPVTLTFTPSPTIPATNTATATATPAAAAWRGEYFNNQDLSGSPVFVRDDPNLAFSWGSGSPAANFPADNFSVRWTRTVLFAPATYRFYARADDGVRIWLDNDLIINEWHEATSQTYSAERTVSAGNHTIRVEYYENVGNAQIQVWWEQAGQFPQWRGEYFLGTNLQGPVQLLRNDAEINFNWGQGVPDSSLPADNFSVRWTRSVNFTAGRYRFNALVDDGVRIYLDGVLILDDWREGGERTLFVERDVTAATHLVQVEYFEGTGEARIRVWWELVETTSFPDWKGEYWGNMNHAGTPTVTRNDVNLDFNWGQGSPANGIPVDGFSCRWTRTVNLEGGRYRFYAQANDGVRVIVDGTLIINEWHLSDGSTVYTVERDLTNGLHTIIVEHFEETNNALIKFWYERIGN